MSHWPFGALDGQELDFVPEPGHDLMRNSLHSCDPVRPVSSVDDYRRSQGGLGCRLHFDLLLKMLFSWGERLFQPYCSSANSGYTTWNPPLALPISIDAAVAPLRNRDNDEVSDVHAHRIEDRINRDDKTLASFRANQRAAEASQRTRFHSYVLSDRDLIAWFAIRGIPAESFDRGDFLFGKRKKSASGSDNIGDAIRGGHR
jgi:hypothetical protein